MKTQSFKLMVYTATEHGTSLQNVR